VKNRFQAFAFKFNLCRYASERAASAAAATARNAAEAGLYRLNPVVDP
jgi:hypothetical protein